MEPIENKSICLALLYQKDGRYARARKPASFTNRKAFYRYLEYNRDIIFHDEVLMILLGGEHKVVDLATLRCMSWVMESACLRGDGVSDDGVI